jgi:hypothetical protein
MRMRDHRFLSLFGNRRGGFPGSQRLTNEGTPLTKTLFLAAMARISSQKS